jgi:hypothetical protein
MFKGTNMNDESVKMLITTIRHLTVGVEKLAECFRPHFAGVTKQDLIEMENRIMAREQDIIDAANKLSTASDAVSIKLDVLTAKVDEVIAALQNEELTPEGEAALKGLQAAAATAAAAGDKVDAEVAKLDKVLPTPAPAAPITPV